MALESYKKEQKRLEKEENVKNGVPEAEKKVMPLSDIISNKEMSPLFGKMLEADGELSKELISELMSGKIDGSYDIGELEKHRADFAERMEKAENIKEELTPELAAELGALDPEFEKIVNLVGSEKSISLIHKEIKSLSVTDPDRFNKISGQIEKLQSFRDGDMKDLGKSITEFSKTEGVNEEKYLKALAIENEDDRKKALKDMVRAEYGDGAWGTMKRSTDSLFGVFGGSFSKRKAEKLGDKKTDIDAAFAEIESLKKKIGFVLSESVGGNKDLQEALSREIVGQPKKKEAVGMADAKKDMPTDTQVQQKWAENKKTIVGWDKLSDTDKDVHREKFIEKYSNDTQEAYGKKEGFWFKIFQACAEALLSINKESLK